MAKKIDTSLLDEAVKFAVDAHAGTERRGKGFPYIVHPMEAVSIVSTITSDQELLAAAALHDVVEDTEYTEEDIRERFGDRVAGLVATESDVVVEGKTDEESWHERKQAAIERLAAASHDGKVVAMGDKLSNMRAIARDYEVEGDAFWNRFHSSDPKDHEWHYRGLAESLSELADTDAYKEFVELINRTFQK
ncbi:MAG: HD domain-containing protein [Clostridia bacterium]|nr:HD domain-containing protein [Clostridia bacterium]